MTDPTTAVFAFVSRHVAAIQAQYGLTDADIRLMAIALASFMLFVVLLRARRGRVPARKVAMTAGERAALRSVRHARMPGELHH